MNRRHFLGAAVAGSVMLVGSRVVAYTSRPLRITIARDCPDTPKTRLAVQELRAGLLSLRLADEISEGNAKGSLVLTLRLDSRLVGEAYEIAAAENGAIISGGQEQALLYGVFDFLEQQGILYGIDGTVVPVDLPQTLNLPTLGAAWKMRPEFATRGLIPWPDFLNCISIYNDEDFKAYFAAMLRMRMNMFGMHVYTGGAPVESYLSFDFAGAGHQAELENTTTTGWGYLPQRTSTYKQGAAQYFAGETFGADAQIQSRDMWEVADRTTAMLRSGFEFARSLGIKTGIGFEPYVNPPGITSALPPEAAKAKGGLIESRTGRLLLERRLADLLERYPSVDNVWLWEDETTNWNSRNSNIPLSVTPFMQAYEFLKRHAPEKRLVLGGWGGITRNFKSLHERLPEDIIFSALNDSLGWDPVHEAFGDLGGRERWPIPWLEDDPSMWLPQFRASQVEVDMKQASALGCQGMLGIHWRHRIVDPTATYFSRRAWSPGLSPVEHYGHYASTQASGKRVAELTTLLNDCDTGRAIVSTFTGDRDKEGFAVVNGLTPDYEEGFVYWKYRPDAKALPIQRDTAARFKALADTAETPLETERLGYFSGFVALMVPYCDAAEQAWQLDAVLKKAIELREADKEPEAKRLVLQKGVPLWLHIAPEIRQTLLDYQSIVSTRNDLGQLASMQNKAVRMALERLRLSVQEFAGELPEMDRAYAAAIAPAQNPAPRLFLPTRLSLLTQNEKMRLFIMAPDSPAESAISLNWRVQGARGWNRVRARHEGRSVYSAELGPFTAKQKAIEYTVSMTAGAQTLTSPPQVDRAYQATILG